MRIHRPPRTVTGVTNVAHLPTSLYEHCSCVASFTVPLSLHTSLHCGGLLHPSLSVHRDTSHLLHSCGSPERAPVRHFLIGGRCFGRRRDKRGAGPAARVPLRPLPHNALPVRITASMLACHGATREIGVRFSDGKLFLASYACMRDTGVAGRRVADGGQADVGLVVRLSQGGGC